MADSQTPGQPETPRPETASEWEHARWREVCERAQVAVAEKPVKGLSSDANTGSAVSSTPRVDAALIPAGVNYLRPEGDTPWTGEDAPRAADATSVVESAGGGAEVRARSLPDRPWGYPRLRMWFWLVAAILVAAAIVLISFSGVASILVGLAAIVVAIRAFRGVSASRLERRIAPRAARNVGDEPPSSPGDGPASGEGSGDGPVAEA